MGRQPIGDAARNKIGSVRITIAERDYFDKTFGGIGPFLRAKVDEELARAAAGQRCGNGQHVTPHRGCILR